MMFCVLLICTRDLRQLFSAMSDMQMSCVEIHQQVRSCFKAQLQCCLLELLQGAYSPGKVL